MLIHAVTSPVMRDAITAVVMLCARARVKFLFPLPLLSCIIVPLPQYHCTKCLTRFGVKNSGLFLT